jgi:membrane protein
MDALVRSLEAFRRGVDLLRYVAAEFNADRCGQAAAALAYTTILTLVPLLTVVFVTLAAFPAFQEWNGQIERFVFDNFVPALGGTIRNYMSEFARAASGLRAVGLAVLLVTVLLLIWSIEDVFNTIWRAPPRRRLLQRFMLYWSALTLGTLLVGTGLAVSSYVVSLPFVTEVDTTLGLRGKILPLAPLVTSYLALFVLYTYLPNREVPPGYGACGALVGAVLFELAKRGFTYYIVTFPTNEAIYGAFATIPIFLVWVYLSWVVVLFGAVLTRCLAIPNLTTPGSSRLRSLFVDACRVVARLAAARARGNTLREHELLRGVRGVGGRRLNDILDRLGAAQWCARTDSGGFTLLRDLETTTLLDLYDLVPGPLPLSIGEDDPDLAQPCWQAICAQHARVRAEGLKVPLRAAFTARG